MARKKSPTIVHINKHTIARNRTHGTNDPPVSFKKKSGGKATLTHGAVIVDNNGNELARIVHRPHAPLKCGARCWIETQYKVIPEEEFDNPLSEESKCLDLCTASCS